jgi:hypothetical protein
VNEETQLQTRVDTTPDLSVLLVTLLKGVIYRDGDALLWSSLLNLQAQVRDYVTVLGLELTLDEAEGYGFLRSLTMAPDQEETMPRLVARRPLSFYDSLLLALLRKKLAEFDAGGSEPLLVMTSDEIQDLIRLFLPERSDEVKLRQKIERNIQRLHDMGFLRKLKSTSAPQSYEVRRILKAFVDAQWLAGLDQALEEYKVHLAGQRREAEENGID